MENEKYNKNRVAIFINKIANRKSSIKNYFCGSLCVLCVSLCNLFLTSCNKNNIPDNLKKANELVWVEGGSFQQGNENTPDANPKIEQQIQGFWMNKYEITNAQFRTFVNKTGYKTLAEKNGGSYVFVENFLEDSLSIRGAPWWRFRQNANWKNPRGDKNIKGIDDYSPVTHIAYEDACAYCEWLQMRLPKEAEWEYAATKNGAVQEMNIWQGVFPNENISSDGYKYTSPVGAFPAGELGLHDMNGNVWEWCADYYHTDWYKLAGQFPLSERNEGPPTPYDANAFYDTSRVIRGGSYLCSDNYCAGYLPYTRMRSNEKMTFGHIGFRCVKNK